jgi:hypothetical protein
MGIQATGYQFNDTEWRQLVEVVLGYNISQRKETLTVERPFERGAILSKVEDRDIGRDGGGGSWS